MDDESGNLVLSIVFVIGLFVLAYFISTLLNHKYFFFRRDRFVVLWFNFVILARLTLDLPFVMVSLFESKLENYGVVVLAKEYGKVDMRWMRSDPSIVALELGSVLFETTLAYLVIRGIVLGTVYRHFAQTCACVLQVYRAWLIFAPEILSGFADIRFSNPVYVILYLVVYNFIWTAFPLLILYETYLDASTGVMRYITPYRMKSPLRSSNRRLSALRNRDSWFWHS